MVHALSECLISLCLESSVSTTRIRSCGAEHEEEDWYPAVLGSCCSTGCACSADCAPFTSAHHMIAQMPFHLVSASTQKGSVDLCNKILLYKRSKRVKSITDERIGGWEQCGY